MSFNGFLVQSPSTARFLDLLFRLCSESPNPSILIVCISKEDFLESLTSTNNHNLLLQFHNPPSLSLIATMANLSVFYPPTLTHLRALLGSLYVTADPDLNILALWHPAALHKGTREYSFQGISHTVASALQVRDRSRVVFGLEPGADLAEHIGVLNGVAQEREREREAGRTVELGGAFARWCRIINLVDEDVEVESGANSENSGGTGGLCLETGDDRVEEAAKQSAELEQANNY